MHAKFFRYLSLHMKAETISIIISSTIGPFTLKKIRMNNNHRYENSMTPIHLVLRIEYRSSRCQG